MLLNIEQPIEIFQLRFALQTWGTGGVLKVR